MICLALWRGRFTFFFRPVARGDSNRWSSNWRGKFISPFTTVIVGASYHGLNRRRGTDHEGKLTSLVSEAAGRNLLDRTKDAAAALKRGRARAQERRGLDFAGLL